MKISKLALASLAFGWVLLSSACSLPISIPFLATSTPTPTLTPTPTPTPTATPSPTPSPTPLPAAQVKLGEDTLFLGDYEAARREFQLALAAASDADTQAAASTGIGRALYLALNYSTAEGQLKKTIETYPKAKGLAETWFLLAQCQTAQQKYADAAASYQAYLDLRPGVLTSYVQEQRGDALLSAGDAAGAAKAYDTALQDPPSGNPDWLRIKLARSYSAQNDYTKAVTLYLDIYKNSTNDYARAQVNFLMGQIYLGLNQPEQAYARFNDSVLSFPKAYDTYSGLIELVNAGQPISELNRGIIDYYAGQYGLCAEALTRFIESGAATEASPYYYRGLCRQAVNQPVQAIADFTAVIQNYPSDSLWSSAADEKAYTQWAYLDQYEQAANTLLAYVEKAKDLPDAPDALYNAARIYERGGMLDKAAATWEQLINTFPAAEKSYRGLFLAGVTYYRLGDYPKARMIFQRSLVLGSEPADQAAAYLWIGKCYQAEGNNADAKTSWEQSVQRDPTGYYSIRASEILAGSTPFSSSQPVNLGYDLNTERAQAETWLRSTFHITSDVNLADLSSLRANPAFSRGEELLKLGLPLDASSEFESVRKAVSADPVDTYRLTNFLLEHNQYRLAIFTSRQVLDLAGMDDAATLRAPVYFNHIRFGVYFRDLIMEAAQKEGLPPLFLLSVIRQESLFQPNSASSAGARGLMQILPATGKELADELKFPADYSADDLDRPIVAIPFGAHYLMRQRLAFKGDLTSALAAYNGGPGNTATWSELAKGDPDLLLETIRADETRTYIKQIYEFYNIYRFLYEQRP